VDIWNGSAFERFYVVRDGTNSVRMLLDSVGNIAAEYDYDAFGNVLRSTINTPITTQNSFGFHSEHKDSATALVYLRARWYAPSEGRFLCKDEFEGTQEQPMTLNKYLGFSDNPVNLTDPSGNFSVMEAGISIGAMSILSVMPVNLWVASSEEAKIKQLILYFALAANNSQNADVDIKALASLAWSESGSQKLGYWDRELNSSDDPFDVGIMRINSKVWDSKTKYYAYSGMSDQENILKGAQLLDGYCMNKAKKAISNGKYGGMDLLEGEDELFVSVWVYKGFDKKSKAEFWKNQIYKKWPDVTAGDKPSQLLIKLWNERSDIIKAR